MERFLGTPDAEPNRTEGTRAFARERQKKKKNPKKFVTIVLQSFWYF